MHRFGGLIGINIPCSETFYISPQNAKALATELRRFAKNIDENPTSSDPWLTTRIIKNGKGISQSTGKAKVEFVG